MKKIISIILTSLIVCSSMTVLAGKQSPAKTWDFNSKNADGISFVDNGAYISGDFEAGIGNDAADDYSYKISTNHPTSATSGSHSYKISIDTSAVTADVVTTEFRIFVNTNANPSAKESQTPIVQINSSTASGDLVWLRPTSYQYGGASSWNAIGTGAPYFGKWSEIAITVDKTNKKFSMYLDGAEVCPPSDISSKFSDNKQVNISLFYYYNAPGENCFMAIDDIKLYDGVYQPDDIISWYNQNGEIKSLSDINEGDIVYATLNTYNYSEANKPLTAVLLVRCGSKLISAKSKSYLVPLDLNQSFEVKSEGVEITSKENLEIKYVILDSWDNRKPLCDAYSLK